MNLFSKKNEYGINVKENNNQKTVLSAFHGGFFGPSYYYYINNYSDTFEFRFGFSKDGLLVDNDENNPNLHIIKKDEEYYNRFMEELLFEIKDWDEIYINPNIMDGMQWNIKLIEQNRNYSGSNSFPANYDKVRELFNKYFDVELFFKY